ncbi:hypothetical protein GCM10023257_07020 [Streptomyces hyderabadensis]|uniref:Uncharacterized protein n=1 Tax=Streptomyces hyderabadensis TaxID=598549 RepID=A0ABP9HLG3_9ACTN
MRTAHPERTNDAATRVNRAGRACPHPARRPESPPGAASVHGHTPGPRTAIGDDTQMVRRPTPIVPGCRTAPRPGADASRPTRGSRPRRVLRPRVREDDAHRGMTGDFPGSPP